MMHSYEVRCIIESPDRLDARLQGLIQNCVQQALLAERSPLPFDCRVVCVETMPVCDQCDGSVGAVVCHCPRPAI